MIHLKLVNGLGLDSLLMLVLMSTDNRLFSSLGALVLLSFLLERVNNVPLLIN